MIDVGSITAAVTGLKTATDIVKGILEIKSISEVQTKVIELQGVILSAQSSALAAQSDQMALLEKVREMKTQITQLEAWETDKKRYHLTDYGGGTFAYALKEDESDGEPPHRICAACYQKGHKSILQNLGGQKDGRDRYQCAECKGLFLLGEYRRAALPTQARTSRSRYLDR
jgi:hypothetical protein